MKANENFRMTVSGATTFIDINAKCFSPFDISSIKTGDDSEQVCEQLYSTTPADMKPLKQVIKM